MRCSMCGMNDCCGADMEQEITRLRAEIAELRNRLVNLEDEKNTYIEYVGDALGQDHDGESLWDAAQRVLSDRDRIRVERDELRAESAAKDARIAELEGALRRIGSWVMPSEIIDIIRKALR